MDMLDGGRPDVVTLEDVGPGSAPAPGPGLGPAPGQGLGPAPGDELATTQKVEEREKFPLPDNGVRIVVVIGPRDDFNNNNNSGSGSSGSGGGLKICNVATEMAREESALAFVALLANEAEKQAKRAKLGGKKKPSEFDNVSLYAPEGDPPWTIPLVYPLGLSP